MHPTPPVLPGKPPQPAVCKGLQAFYSKMGQLLAGLLCAGLLLCFVWDV